jgi:hypothetical protein
MTANKCVHFLIAIAKFDEAIEKLNLIPQPHPPAVVQAIQNATNDIRMLEREYAACIK